MCSVGCCGAPAQEGWRGSSSSSSRRGASCVCKARNFKHPGGRWSDRGSMPACSTCLQELSEKRWSIDANARSESCGNRWPVLASPSENRKISSFFFVPTPILFLRLSSFGSFPPTTNLSIIVSSRWSRCWRRGNPAARARRRKKGTNGATAEKEWTASSLSKTRQQSTRQCTSAPRHKAARHGHGRPITASAWASTVF